MWYLPTEVLWRARQAREGRLFLDIHERFPRTLDGTAWWVTGHAEVSGLDRGGQDHVHFAYIKYRQNIEDFDEAVNRRGERVLNFDRLIRGQAQELTLWG